MRERERQVCIHHLERLREDLKYSKLNTNELSEAVSTIDFVVWWLRADKRFSSGRSESMKRAWKRGRKDAK